MIEVIEDQYEETYGEFVKRLFKIPVGEQSGLMHAAIGIAGEAAEFSGAESRENLLEECGDIEFYVEACWQQVPEEYRANRLSRGERSSRYAAFGDLSMVLMDNSGHLLDAAKKGWAYIKPVDWAEVISRLTATELILDDIYEYLGTEKDIIRMRNIGKLNRRYSEGKYSDAQAIERADKDEAIA